MTRDLVAEASAWFVEFRDGNVPDSTRARFNDWLRRSPEHIQAYLEVSAAWSELPTSDPEGRFDVETLITRARESADDNVVDLATGAGSPAAAAQTRPTVTLRMGAVRFAIAASVALLAIGAGIWLEFFRAATYSTGVGEQRTVLLKDGSTVELNALSTVRVRMAKSLREIELVQGQALFKVAKDPSRPFIVESGTTRVRAVGTQFDVYRRLSGTTITVLEGEVSVAAPPAAGTAVPDGQQKGTEPAILLSAGQQVTVQGDRFLQPKKTDTTAATAWVQHRLIFEATPLADVADEFNRYSVKKLVIADSALRALGISGVYSSSDPESLIGFLRAHPTLAVTEMADEIRVTRRDNH